MFHLHQDTVPKTLVHSLHHIVGDGPQIAAEEHAVHQNQQPCQTTKAQSPASAMMMHPDIAG